MPEMKKSFSLPQGRTELAIPLQLDHQEWAGSKRAVTKQPKHTRSISEPSRPTSYVPDPTMFDLKNAPRMRLRSLSEVRSTSPRDSPPSLSTTHSLPASLPPSLFPEGQTSHQPHQYHHEHEDSGSWKPSLSSIADADESEERRESGIERGGEGGGGRRGGRNGSGSPSVLPEIEFSLYYDIQCRTLTVHLQCVRRLSARSKKAGVSPIVLLYLLPNREDIFESKMVQNSVNPISTSRSSSAVSCQTKFDGRR